MRPLSVQAISAQLSRICIDSGTITSRRFCWNIIKNRRQLQVTTRTIEQILIVSAGLWPLGLVYLQKALKVAD